jgi:hypothetical protein
MPRYPRRLPTAFTAATKLAVGSEMRRQEVLASVERALETSSAWNGAPPRESTQSTGLRNDGIALTLIIRELGSK